MILHSIDTNSMFIKIEYVDPMLYIYSSNIHFNTNPSWISSCSIIFFASYLSSNVRLRKLYRKIMFTGSSILDNMIICNLLTYIHTKQFASTQETNTFFKVVFSTCHRSHMPSLAPAVISTYRH